MKWTYSIKNKTTAAILLAAILGLTMLTNLLQRKRFQELEHSFTSIYEDRLLAESYLFHLYVDLKKEQDILQLLSDHGLSYGDRTEMDKDRAERDTIMAKYAETYLTEEEEIQFDRLKTILNDIDVLEQKIESKENQGVIPPDLILAHNQTTNQAFLTISDLSDIQTSEGERLQQRTKQIILGSVSISQFEMTILIVIAIVIQGLIFSSKTLLIKSQGQDPGLN
ncbi:MAG: hypothetical protein R2824_04260 [Saprospiraceae bacterium]